MEDYAPCSGTGRRERGKKAKAFLKGRKNNEIGVFTLLKLSWIRSVVLSPPSLLRKPTEFDAVMGTSKVPRSPHRETTPPSPGKGEGETAAPPAVFLTSPPPGLLS